MRHAGVGSRGYSTRPTVAAALAQLIRLTTATRPWINQVWEHAKANLRESLGFFGAS